MRKKWVAKEPDIELQRRLSADLGSSNLFAQLLINRGLIDPAAANHFLEADLGLLHDPFLMEGMKEAASCLRRAVEKKEKVFIATDFDVDGVTSCAVLENALVKMGVCVAHYVPHRVRDGYGLNEEAVRQAEEFGAKIFVSLDCGITAFEQMRHLQQLGIESIIVDHHEPPRGELPLALAILDPKKASCKYPFNDLASVGLAYKLIQAMGIEDLESYLDLVALGTVADVAPLKDENRIFVKHGLDALNSRPREGISALIEASGAKGKIVSTKSISFMLAPRLNASGRVDSAHASLDLLLARDKHLAATLAQGLNEQNRRRQKIEEKVLGEALDMVEREVNFKDDFVIVLSREDWHPGVLGIVASKIVDRFYRPTVVISLGQEGGRGSARSVHNFHIYEALARCGKHLKEYGGHQYAAGLSIEKEDIEGFKKVLNEAAKEHFQQNLSQPFLDVDAEIPLAMIDEELLRFIDRLSPFGEGNPRPVFVSKNLMVKSKPLVVGRNSLKFWVTDGARTFQAIGFGLGGFLDLVVSSAQIDLAYALGWDEWNSAGAIQLEVKDIQASALSF